MRKLFFLGILFILKNEKATSQSISYRLDSLKIDSIKKALSHLNNTVRIESMILLCEYYSDKLRDRNMNAADSVRVYGNKILNESKKVGYKRGIAMGILATAQDSSKERGAREAMEIGKEIGDKEVTALAATFLNTTTDVDQNIANQQQIIDQYTKAGKILRATYLKTWLCQAYSGSGQNEKAFDCAKENLEALRSMQSPEFAFIYTQSWLWNYWNLYQIYSAAGDYEEALKFIRKTGDIDKADNPQATDWTFDISGIYALLGNYDSAMIYWQRFRNVPTWDDPNFSWPPGKKLAYNHLAALYKMNKQYDKAIEILKDNIVYFDSLLKFTTGNFNNAGNYGKMAASITLSAIYDSLKNYKLSLSYAKDGFYNAQVKNRRPEMMQASQLLSRAYHNLNNNDSAYAYLEKYVNLKDSVQSKQFLLRIYNAKKQADEERKTSRINFLNQENQLRKSELRQEGFIKNSLAAGLVLLILLGIFIFRNLLLKRKAERFRLQKEMELQQIENEKRQSELQRQAVELEMQALRAQMNPHFIFNCLSSINRFIFKNDNQTASDYLTKFSRLIRMVLIHSQKRFIPLEDELEMLRLYLDMERLRFKNEFDYSITTNNTIDAGAIFIPPLLFQPFCENAIWHGLMHKEGRGHLNISITEENKTLLCSIVDDGVGREKAAEFKSKSAEKEKSLGLKITTARLALLNCEVNNETSYKIDDVLDEAGNVCGTTVDLKIKYKETIEAPEHA